MRSLTTPSSLRFIATATTNAIESRARWRWHHVPRRRGPEPRAVAARGTHRTAASLAAADAAANERESPGKVKKEMDACFDVVLANHMLYHVPDRSRAMSELALGGLEIEGAVVASGRDHRVGHLEAGDELADLELVRGFVRKHAWTHGFFMQPHNKKYRIEHERAAAEGDEVDEKAFADTQPASPGPAVAVSPTATGGVPFRSVRRKGGGGDHKTERAHFRSSGAATLASPFSVSSQVSASSVEDGFC